MNQSKFIKEVVVIDPDSKGEVHVAIFKHENGGIFGIDSSYIEQTFEDDELVVVPDPFSDDNETQLVTLMGVDNEEEEIKSWFDIQQEIKEQNEMDNQSNQEFDTHESY